MVHLTSEGLLLGAGQDDLPHSMAAQNQYQVTPQGSDMPLALTHSGPSQQPAPLKEAARKIYRMCFLIMF